MWQKKESKLELAASMIRQVMPEFHSKDHIIILCDSWYTKQNLVSIVDEYPNLDLIGNARIDSVMYDPAPAHTGRRGRPAKHRKRLSVETDFTFSNEKIGDYYIGAHRVITNLFGCREIQAYGGEYNLSLMVGKPAICCFVAIEKRHIAAALLLCPVCGMVY